MIIYKYPLGSKNPAVIKVPENFNILHLGLDPKGQLCLWAAVDEKSPLHEVTLHLIGTGETVPDAKPLVFLDTVVVGEFVLHVFIEKIPAPVINLEDYMSKKELSEFLAYYDKVKTNKTLAKAFVDWVGTMPEIVGRLSAKEILVEYFGYFLEYKLQHAKGPIKPQTKA